MLRSPGCKVASVYESVCDCVCVQTSNVCCANMYVPIPYYVCVHAPKYTMYESAYECIKNNPDMCAIFRI